MAIATAMHDCFAFWRRPDSGCRGAMVLSSRDMWPGAGWGLMDSEDNSKAALAVSARTWAPVTVLVSDDGLSGIRIDIHNDSPQARSGELNVIATNSTGIAVDTTLPVTVAGASSISFRDAELSGTSAICRMRSASGPPTADAVQATVRFDDGAAARDVLVVKPRGGQSPALVRAALTRQSEDQWRLELTSEVALRFTQLHFPSWRTSDNYFHLASRAPVVVTLSQCGAREKPIGTVASIDLLSPLAVRPES